MTCWRPPNASLRHDDGLRLTRNQERLGRMASSSARVRGVCSAGASVSALSVSPVTASSWGTSIPRARDRSATAARAEAARSLGLSNWHTFWDVIFPQAFKIALPPLVNNFIALLKDSSLAYAIGVVELTNVANRIQSSTFQPIPPLVTAAVIYLLLTTVLTQISTAVEHRMDVEGRQK